MQHPHRNSAESHHSLGETNRGTTLFILMMWGAYVLNYCDRQAIFAMFGALRADLKMSDDALGLVGALFLWIYGCMCPIAGYLADHVSKRILVIFSLAVWSAVTIATGFVTSPMQLLVLRGMMGISEALYMPAAIALTASIASDRFRSTRIALLMTAQVVGTVAGSWYGGWMADQGIWRWAFLILGGIGIVYALPYYLVLKRYDDRMPEDSARPIETPSSLALLRIPTFMMLGVVYPCFVFGLWLLYSWLPNYLENKFHLTASSAALLATATIQPGTLLGLALGGILADRWALRFARARYGILAMSFFGCAPCLHAIGQCQSIHTTGIVSVAFGITCGILMGNIFPATFEVVPARLRASAVGILNFIGAILSGFAPWVVGRWKGVLGVETILSLTAVVYLVAGVIIAISIFWFCERDARLQSSWEKEHR